MMTVIRLFRKQTSAPTLPRWIRLTGEPTAPGSAKPGRGGRRKRKADRAKIRARIGAGVERKGWPLSWALRKWAIIKGPARRWTDAEIAALAQGPWFVLPAGCELQIVEPEILGRRERRRRAKLRRRRARRREGRPTPIAVPMSWEAATLEHATGAHLDRLAAMFGVKRTPGA